MATVNTHEAKTRLSELTWAHARELRVLPLLHRDPFDRLLVAQARLERRTLVTTDAQIRGCDVATMPA